MIAWTTSQNAPTHRTVEMSGGYDGGLFAETYGLMADTRVASNLGWRNAEALTVGDKVLTFDHGMQPITRINRVPVWVDAPHTAAPLWSVVVPVDALGNSNELFLLPDQGVMIECDAAFDRHGDPFAVVPAAALVGMRGIHRRRPVQPATLIAVHFEQDEVIYAEGGALILAPRDMSTLDSFLDGAPQSYDVLDPTEARRMAECIALEDRMLARSSVPQAMAM